MIGDRLRELRKARKMTQEQVAAYLNAAKSTISQYENNINEPDLETLVKLADWFGVTIDDLLGRSLYDQRPDSGSSNSLLMERLTEDEEEYLKESLAMYRRFRSKQSGREE
ncbi:helix-turn-helix domain-containing protein [Paenibacillus tarimensis]|uniref:helix-turn-helix domain-containing protein n=1 Tax=Paenibacillus tarimensis TaxID=416012 RepID=UPI001F447BB9|nr:helix-turn-helix transcriptional regulator [Paenibacillus tarimensis]MCF2943628.1 helix-turn-helix domain-containing protein [Paenibacillus tarimensis]